MMIWPRKFCRVWEFVLRVSSQVIASLFHTYQNSSNNINSWILEKYVYLVYPVVYCLLLLETVSLSLFLWKLALLSSYILHRPVMEAAHKSIFHGCVRYQNCVHFFLFFFLFLYLVLYYSLSLFHRRGLIVHFTNNIIQHVFSEIYLLLSQIFSYSLYK